MREGTCRKWSEETRDSFKTYGDVFGKKSIDTSVNIGNFLGVLRNRNRHVSQRIRVVRKHVASVQGCVMRCRFLVA